MTSPVVPAAQTEESAPSTEQAAPDYVAYERAANEAQKNGTPLEWPPAAESAPAEVPTSETPAEEAEVETAPASEPGKTEEPPKPEAGKGVKARNAKLDQEIQDLQAKLARRHELRQELERGEAKPAPPAAETAPIVVEGKPGEAEFTAILDKSASYEEAVAKFADLRDDWNRKQWKAEQEAEAAQRSTREAAQRFQESLLASQAAHEDHDEVMNSPAVKSIRLTAESKTALDAYVLRKAENPGELLYWLGSHPAEFRKIANGDAITVIAELAKIEAGLNGKAGPVAAPAPKKHSSAPPPVTELAARTEGGHNEIEDAVRSQDYKAYERAANAAELRERKRA